MIEAFKTIFNSLNQLRNQGYSYIWANMAFIVLSLPLITLPAAYSALMRVGHAAHTDSHHSDLGLMWETFKENFWRALPWGVAHAVFALVNFTNLLSFSGSTGWLAGVLQFCWLLAGLVWLAILLYTWPIYYEMKQPDLLGATRNALVMVLQNPVFTLVLILWVSILMVLSTILVATWALLTWGAIAALANAAVMNRLNAYREAQRLEYLH